jgi:hypothetical protein
VCKKYFKQTRIRSDPPAVRVAPRVDTLSQLDVAHAAAVYTPGLSDDVRNTMSSGCRRAADFGFHNPKLKHEAEDKYTASHFPRTGSDPALHTNQLPRGGRWGCNRTTGMTMDCPHLHAAGDGAPHCRMVVAVITCRRAGYRGGAPEGGVSLGPPSAWWQGCGCVGPIPSAAGAITAPSER